MLKKSGKIVFLTSFTLFLVGVIIVPLVSAENVTPNTTPFITIDPIGNHTIDEVFFINGTTSLPANNELLLDIFTSNMNPGGWGSAFSSNVSIQTGENGVNLWSCNATTDRWVTFPGPTPDAVPGQYIVEVASFTEPVVATQLFSLLPSESTIAPSYKKPVAAFAFSGNRTIEPYDMAPLAVQFTDTSANSPTSWLWSFGDGGTSSSQNPSHTYTNAGTYSVMLTVTNVAGSNTYIMKSGITITASSVSAPTSTTNQEISSPLASTGCIFQNNESLRNATADRPDYGHIYKLPDLVVLVVWRREYIELPEPVTYLCECRYLHSSAFGSQCGRKQHDL